MFPIRLAIRNQTIPVFVGQGDEPTLSSPFTHQDHYPINSLLAHSFQCTLLKKVCCATVACILSRSCAIISVESSCTRTCVSVCCVGCCCCCSLCRFVCSTSCLRGRKPRKSSHICFLVWLSCSTTLGSFPIFQPALNTVPSLQTVIHYEPPPLNKKKRNISLFSQMPNIQFHGSFSIFSHSTTVPQNIFI